MQTTLIQYIIYRALNIHDITNSTRPNNLKYTILEVALLLCSPFNPTMLPRTNMRRKTSPGVADARYANNKEQNQI
jgi:hypothetical protein